MTLIIAARNEAANIARKLDDALAQGYPELEILVVSDASEDDTDSVVRGYADRGVRLVRQPERLGKEAAQARGIREAGSDLLVFTDVATAIAPGSLAAIAERLGQTGVGAVSSEDEFRNRDGSVSGEGAYVRYEMALRRLESRRAGLVGLSGSLFAARREVCQPWREDIPSDFAVALNCARQGLRAVSDPRVRGIYTDLRSSADEFARKRRTVVRGMAALAVTREVLDPRRFGLFAFQVWSHKVMRWAVPWCLGGLLLASLALADEHWIYGLALAAQLMFYGLAAVGAVLPGTRRLTAVRIPYYFVQVNLAMAAAFLDFLRGRRVVVWEPSKR